MLAAKFYEITGEQDREQKSEKHLDVGVWTCSRGEVVALVVAVDC